MNTKNKKLFLKLKDYSISNESFSLFINTEYGFLETYPKPNIENLDKYYESQEYISHTDSSKTILDKIYQKVKKITLSQKVNLLKKHIKKGDILDIGAGTGDFLNVAKSKGFIVFGTEPNQNARNLAKSKNIDLVEDIKYLPEKQFDAITLWHVLEHIYNLEEFLNKLSTLLKPNGVLIIAVPNYNSYDAKYYKNFWAAYDVPRHLWHFSKNSIKKLFSNYGFNTIHVKPMWFDSFYVSLLSEKYKTSKTNWFISFFIGLYSNLYGIVKKEFSSHIYLLKKSK